MSAPRKVEIPHTDLMNWMERLIANCAPYRRAIVAGILAFLVLVAAYFILKSRRESQAANSWDRYFANKPDGSGDAKQLDQVRDTVKALGNTPAGNILQLRLAQELLELGVNQLYVDREDGRKKLNEARAIFSNVVQNAGQTILREPALLGLAQTDEALGDTAAAIKTYIELQENFRNGLYAKLAEDRIAKLKKPAAGEFYAWFKTAKLPEPGLGLNNPFDLQGLLNPKAQPGEISPSGGSFLPPLQNNPFDKEGPVLPATNLETPATEIPAKDDKTPAAVAPSSEKTPAATTEVSAEKAPALPPEPPAKVPAVDKSATEKSPAPSPEPAKVETPPASTPPALTTPAPATPPSPPAAPSKAK